MLASSLRPAGAAVRPRAASCTLPRVVLARAASATEAPEASTSARPAPSPTPSPAPARSVTPSRGREIKLMDGDTLVSTEEDRAYVYGGMAAMFFTVYSSLAHSSDGLDAISGVLGVGAAYVMAGELYPPDPPMLPS